MRWHLFLKHFVDKWGLTKRKKKIKIKRKKGGKNEKR